MEGQRELQLLKKQRNAVRSHAKRLINATSDLLQPGQESTDINLLTSKVKILQDYQAKLGDYDWKIQEGMTDEAAQECDIEEAMDLQSLLTESRSLLQVRLETLSQPNGAHSQPQGNRERLEDQLERLLQLEVTRLGESGRMGEGNTSGAVSVKLPKLDFSKFGGDILRWREFWDSFEASVDKNSKLQPVEKLSYLRAKLEGNAKECIAGLETTNANYAVAVTILIERFGRPQVMIDAHYMKLMDLPPAQDTVSKLRATFDQIEKHLRCLESLGEDTGHRHFVSLIKGKLPKNVIIDLEKMKTEEGDWTVELLRKKLKIHLNAREAAETQKTSRTVPCDSDDDCQTSKGRSVSTAEALSAEAGSKRGLSKKKCVYCNKDHWSDDCRRYSNIEERKKQIRGRCYICLSKEHKLRDCPVDRPCYHCSQKKNHHRSLCPKKFPFKESGKRESANLVDSTAEEDDGAAPVACESNLLATGEQVLMQTAMITLKNPISGTEESVRALFDSGSNRSYISKALVKKMNLKLGSSEEISLTTFGTDTVKTLTTLSVKILILFPKKSEKGRTITTSMVPKITGSIRRSQINARLKKKINSMNTEDGKPIELADKLSLADETTAVDLLIGNDYYGDFMTSEKMIVEDGLYLLGSKFGWILSGRTREGGREDAFSFLTILEKKSEAAVTFYEAPDESCRFQPNLEAFWNFKAIGIHDNPIDSDDEKAMSMFLKSVKFEDGRYYVTWPWKERKLELPDNYNLALRRFNFTMKRLKEDKDLFRKYRDIIRDQKNKGIIEEVAVESSNQKHYIPHHPVITPQKTTTKVRIVYNASAREKKTSRTLNECLYRGPVMLKDLCGLLMRFRLKPVALVSDIVVSKGDVVLIKEDLPRGTWKMGVIKDLIVSRDNNIRGARVKLSKGNIVDRSLAHLVPIECPSGEGCLQDSKETESVKAMDSQVNTSSDAHKDTNSHIYTSGRPERLAAIKARKKIKQFLDIDDNYSSLVGSVEEEE